MLPTISSLPDSWRTDLQAKLADDETIVATLVLPYLTMPLMDSLLIPYQNDVPIDTVLV